VIAGRAGFPAALRPRRARNPALDPRRARPGRDETLRTLALLAVARAAR
jgi:hypothetical protein